MARQTNNIFLFFLLLLLSSCLLKSPQEQALGIARRANLSPVIFITPPFSIQGYQRFTGKSQHLTVYIEGDGAAWKNRSTLAQDPTPRQPVALGLASRDPGEKILYLARPCQYIVSPSCSKKYWSSHRYSPEIIRAMGMAIDQAKQESGTSGITLIGYSGGGVVAALLATRRDDISQLVTVAANLDTDFWTTMHQITPLFGSTNPCRYTESLQYIPQIHISGADDTVVPPAVLQSYMDKLPNTKQAQVIIIPGMNHHSNWGERWPRLLDKIHSGTIISNSL